MSAQITIHQSQPMGAEAVATAATVAMNRAMSRPEPMAGRDLRIMVEVRALLVCTLALVAVTLVGLFGGSR